MRDYLDGDQRRRQIIDATWLLLRDRPVAELTTRQIAQALGVSQPAIFRHFSSRDEILLAVLGQARGELADVVERTLTHPSSGLHRIGMLAHGIYQYAEQYPGLPRVLFADVAQGPGSPTQPAIRALLSMLTEVVAELLAADQRSATLSGDLDAHRAATAFVAMQQGHMLQWQLAGRAQGLLAQGEPLLAMWAAAVRAGVPRVAEAPAAESGALPPIAVLDVRPILAGGVDPLQAILAELGKLPAYGLLKVRAPFRPGPLLALLPTRGHAVQARQLGAALWEVEVLGQQAVAPEDLRELEAPLPLERVLLSTAQLGPGDSRLFRLPRPPTLLLPHLQARGLIHFLHVEDDGSALLLVRGKP